MDNSQNKKRIYSNTVKIPLDISNNSFKLRLLVKNEKTNITKELIGIIDTGASFSAINEKFIKDFSLTDADAISTSLSNTASGIVESKIYPFSIIFKIKDYKNNKNELSEMFLKTEEFKWKISAMSLGNIDFLIGMDFLKNCILILKTEQFGFPPVEIPILTIVYPFLEEYQLN